MSQFHINICINTQNTILYSRIICLRGRWGAPFVTQALLTRLVIVTGAIITPITQINGPQLILGNVWQPPPQM